MAAKEMSHNVVLSHSSACDAAKNAALDMGKTESLVSIARQRTILTQEAQPWLETRGMSGLRCDVSLRDANRPRGRPGHASLVVCCGLNRSKIGGCWRLRLLFPAVF